MLTPSAYEVYTHFCHLLFQESIPFSFVYLFVFIYSIFLMLCTGIKLDVNEGTKMLVALRMQPLIKGSLLVLFFLALFVSRQPFAYLIYRWDFILANEELQWLKGWSSSCHQLIILHQNQRLSLHLWQFHHSHFQRFTRGRIRKPVDY